MNNVIERGGGRRVRGNGIVVMVIVNLRIPWIANERVSGNMVDN